MIGSLLLYAWRERGRLPQEVQDRLVMPDVVPKVTDRFVRLMEQIDREVAENRIRRDSGEH